MKPYPPLLDAAGNIVPVNQCWCKRPKPVTERYCCGSCIGDFHGIHGTSCHLRCATLGVPGFALGASPSYAVPGEPIPFHPTSRP